jgi:hypothetical protein
MSYEPNTLGGGCPMQAGVHMGGLVSYPENIDGQKVRTRSASFFDHFSQATLFYRSQSEPEQAHIVNALRFELGKVDTPAIQERMLYLLSYIDHDLANRVADGLGISVPTKLDAPLNMSVPADGDIAQYQPKRVTQAVGRSPALSMAQTLKGTIQTRKIAVLAADGVDSVAALLHEADALHFVREAHKHCKAIAATGAGVELIRAAQLDTSTSIGSDTDAQQVIVDEGVVIGQEAQTANVATAFITAIAQHRHWSREMRHPVPA